MLSVNKTNSNVTSFGRMTNKPSAYHEDKLEKHHEYSSSEVHAKETDRDYFDRRLKEQDENLKKAIDKQNKLIGSSLIALVNYLNGNSDANSTRKLIQSKLINKPEERKIEI